MAFYYVSHCPVCGKDTQHVQSKCTACLAKKQLEADITWENMPTQDQLKDINRRLKKLEQNPVLF